MTLTILLVITTHGKQPQLVQAIVTLLQVPKHPILFVLRALSSLLVAVHSILLQAVSIIY